MNEKNNLGNVKISEDVISILAEKAIREIDGIAGLAGSFADNIAVVLGKKSGVKGVSADIKDGKAQITVHLIIKFGSRIPEIAWKTQEAVKLNVETMTGLDVTAVNVCVDDIRFPEEEAKAVEAENAQDKEPELIPLETIDDISEEAEDTEEN